MHGRRRKPHFSTRNNIITPHWRWKSFNSHPLKARETWHFKNVPRQWRRRYNYRDAHDGAAFSSRNETLISPPHTMQAMSHFWKWSAALLSHFDGFAVKRRSLIIITEYIDAIRLFSLLYYTQIELRLYWKMAITVISSLPKLYKAAITTKTEMKSIYQRFIGFLF